MSERELEELKLRVWSSTLEACLCPNCYKATLEGKGVVIYGIGRDMVRARDRIGCVHELKAAMENNPEVFKGRKIEIKGEVSKVESG